MPVPPKSLWRHRSFLLLWWGQAVSETGSQISLIAIPLVAVVALRADAFQVGLLAALQSLPFLLFGLPAGAWVDRWKRRPILITADVGRLLAMSSIPIAAAFNALTLEQLYVVVFVVGVLRVFFDVAYQSFLPALIPRSQLVSGNAKLQFTLSTAEFAGPGIGGALVGAIGAPKTIIVDAASYAISVLSLLFVRGAKEQVNPKSSRRKLHLEIGEGLKYVLSNKVLRAIAGCTGSWNLFAWMSEGILIFYAVRYLNLTPALIGLWFALGSFGAVAGALVVGKIEKKIGTGPTIRLGALLGAWTYLLVPLAPKSDPLPFLIASGVIGGFCGIIYNVTQVSLRQAITPDRLQGRMNATVRFLVWGTIPIGAFLGGVLAQATSPLVTLWVAAIALCFVPLWVTIGPVPRLKQVVPLEEPALLGGTPEA